MKNKQKRILHFIIILAISLIIFIPWLKPHYSLDNYTIHNYGYDYYSKKWSLLGGRIFMFAILKVAEKTNLSVDIFIVLCEIIAIVISCINISALKEIVIKYKEPDNKLEKAILNVSTYFTIFNFMFIDCMEYIESCVMALSILCYLISANILVNKYKHYNLFNFILVLIGVFCYQGSICMYFAFVTLITIIHNKNSIKTIIIDILKSFGFSITAIGANVAFIKIIEKTFSFNQGRIVGIEKIGDSIMNCITNFGNVLINTCSMFPSYLFLFFFGVITLATIIYALKSNQKNEFIIKYCLISIVCIISTFAFFIMTKSSFYSGRMRLSIGALIGILIIYLYINNIFKNINSITITIVFTIALYSIMTIIMYENIMIIKQKVNSLEKENAIEIGHYIEEYEKKNNTEVKYLVEVYNIKDNYKAYYYNYGKLGLSGLRFHEVAVSVINKYTNCNLKQIVLIKKGKKGLSDDFYEKGYECKNNILYIEVNAS